MALRDTVVFCQISGRDISGESCSRTQGQKACFGCAASTRRCEKCQENFVAVAATGTCSRCTIIEIAAEKNLVVGAPPKKVECQMMKKSISGAMCMTMQGQDGCRGCTAQSRLCESCGERPVRFAQYGFCFTCSVKELGDGWTPEVLDRPVGHPHLRVVPTDAPASTAEKGHEITSLAQDFRRIPLANIRDPENPVRTITMGGNQDLYDLGDSMLSDKLIYPVILEPVGNDFYEVIIGMRRVRSARLKEQIDIPAIIWEPQSPLAKLIVMLAENIHRVQLDPFEEARVFLRLMKEYDLTGLEISAKVNKPAAHIMERIQLLSLSDETQALVAEGAISIDSAAALARLPLERQAPVAREAIEHHLNSREVRKRVHSEAGTSGDTARVLNYYVTPQKLAASVEEFTRWFTRAIPRLKFDGATLEDQTLMLGALTGLETKTQKTREAVKKIKPSRKRKTQ